MLECIHWQPAFQVVLREVSWGMSAVNLALQDCPFLCSFLCPSLPVATWGFLGILGYPCSHDPVSAAVLSALSARLSKSQGSPHGSSGWPEPLGSESKWSYSNWLRSSILDMFFSRSFITIHNWIWCFKHILCFSQCSCLMTISEICKNMQSHLQDRSKRWPGNALLRPCWRLPLHRGSWNRTDLGKCQKTGIDLHRP